MSESNSALPFDVDEEQLARATRHVITSSHYHGSNKDRLYEAVVQTVRGELPLTQAAAAHSIPFSTLHPYVKKVRVKLGILDPSEATPPKRFRPVKRASAGSTTSPSRSTTLSSLHRRHSGGGVRGHVNGKALTNGHRPRDEAASDAIQSGEGEIREKKARRQPAAGYQPFKQIEIPECWKLQPAAMQEAVWGAVQGCQYDDPLKKERLCSAVMEALSGQKTMKAAAATHEVPFTTLQTYFHRSRAKLQRVLGDGTNDAAFAAAAIDQIPVAVSLLSAESPHDSDSPWGDISYHPPPAKKNRVASGGLDALLGRLRQGSPSNEGERGDGEDGDGEGALQICGMQEEPASPGEAPTPPPPPPPPTGSNKRKPKQVQRFVESAAVGNDLSHSHENLFRDEIGKTERKEDDEEEEISPLMAQISAMAAAQMQNGLDHDESEELPFDDDEGVFRIEPTAPEDDDDVAFNGGIEKNHGGISEPFKRRKPQQNGEVDGTAMSREEAIDRAIRNSHYEKDNRQRLRWALLDTMEKTLTLKQAAREYQVPLSTLNTYYMRAKAIFTAANQVGSKYGMMPAVSTTEDENGASPSSTPGTSCGLDTPSRMGKERDAGPLITGPALDPDDRERIDLIENTVNDVCRASLYSNEQKRRLCDAVMLVIKGDCTINAAANMKQLPSSTVHPYVHKARAILGIHLPPQASGPTLWTATRKQRENGNGLPGGDLQSGVEGDAPSPAPSSTDSSSADTQKHSSDDAGNDALDLEELDRIISALVKNSHYDESGRQKLYEATLMVLTENVTASEAARYHQLPASTIQPYVHKARIALGLPTVSNAGTSFMKRNAPVKTQYAKPGCEAAIEEVEAVVEQVLANCNAQSERREKLMIAVLAAVAGRSTIKDACTQQGLPASTVHPYVSKARHMLGDKCPVPKIVLSTTTAGGLGGGVVGGGANGTSSPVPLSMVSVGDTGGRSPSQAHIAASTMPARALKLHRSPARGNADAMSTTKDDDGDSSDEDDVNNIPTTVRGVARMLSRKEIAESEKKDFVGDRSELMRRLMKIMRRYDYRGDRVKMCEAIMVVLLEGKTLAELSATSGLAQTTLSTYVRLAKYFLNTDTMIVTDAPPRPAVKIEKTGGKQGGGEAIRMNKFVKGEVKGEDVDETKKEMLSDEALSPSSVASSDHHRSRFSHRISTTAVVTNCAPMEEPDVMQLHRVETLDDEETSLKLIISYLLVQQFKRLDMQQKMRDALEEVLLNGLSVSEALAIHRGLSEHVLQVYLGRCRDAYKCIRTDFPQFLREVDELPSLHPHYANTESMNHAEPSSQGMVVTPPARSAGARRSSSNASSTASATINANACTTPTRASRRLQAKHTVNANDGSPEMEPMKGNNDGTILVTANLLSDSQLEPLIKYLKKLNNVNFPLETKLIAGLAAIVHSRNGRDDAVAVVSAKQWTEWVARFCKKHPEFVE